METVLPTTTRDRLERSLGVLTPAEHDLAERIEGLGPAIAERVASLEVFDAETDDATPVAAESQAIVRTALLEVAALAAMEELEPRLSDLDRAPAFLTELRAAVLGRDDPGPADPNPTGPLYDLFARPSEILPLERRVRRLAVETTRRVLRGKELPGREGLPSWGERACAYALDWGTAEAVTVVGIAVAFRIHLIHHGQASVAALLAHFVAGVVNANLLATRGASFGKFAMHLRLVDAARGGDVPLARTLLRETIGRMVTVVAFLADLTVFPSPLRQTRADRWARSLVVHDDRPLPHRMLALAGTGVMLLLSVAFFVWSDWQLATNLMR